MEIGRIPDIDNAQLNQVKKAEKIQEVDNNQKVVADEQYKNANKEPEISEVNEVILDNVRFGYNKSSQDFFVKVTRGSAEYKFPTEDMMKMKAFLLDSVQINSEK